MYFPLEELLREPEEQTIVREQSSLETALGERRARVVLFGAGATGKRAAQMLRSIGIQPVAFSDNDKHRWGTLVENIPVLAPIEAAKLYRQTGVVLLSIWNPFHWYAETAKQLRQLGFDNIVSYPALFWRFPEVFLPAMFNDLPHRMCNERDHILAAASLWNDDESRAIYEENIQLRFRGTLDNMPGRPVENTYFPEELFALSDCEDILDCGATFGEMTQELIRKRGDSFKSFHALEADSISYLQLQKYRDSLPTTVQAKVHLYHCAVGLQQQVVYFSNTGDTGSHISSQGVAVDCYPIDIRFASTTLSFIKMDIEGAEYDALLGGSNVIKRDQPIMAICVYHTQSDIWRIPLLVRELLPKHKLYLRAYEGDGFQTILFAVPQHRVRQCSAS
jgi:FkbM family methyltransferase